MLFRSGVDVEVDINVDIMLTLRWRRQCADVTLLRCWLCSEIGRAVMSTLTLLRRWRRASGEVDCSLWGGALQFWGFPRRYLSPELDEKQIWVMKYFYSVKALHTKKMCQVAILKVNWTTNNNLMKHQSFLQCWLICRLCFMSEVKSSPKIGSFQSREYRPTLVVDCCP